MSTRACEANQSLATRTINNLLEDGDSIFEQTDQATTRMMVCGGCPESAVSKGQAKEAFRMAISTLADKITEYDEWGYDPEVSGVKRKKRKKEYRRVKGDEIRAKDKDRRIDRRIEQLRQKKEVHHGGQD